MYIKVGYKGVNITRACYPDDKIDSKYANTSYQAWRTNLRKTQTNIIDKMSLLYMDLFLHTRIFDFYRREMQVLWFKPYKDTCTSKV